MLLFFRDLFHVARWSELRRTHRHRSQRTVGNPSDSTPVWPQCVAAKHQRNVGHRLQEHAHFSESREINDDTEAGFSVSYCGGEETLIPRRSRPFHRFIGPLISTTTSTETHTNTCARVGTCLNGPVGTLDHVVRCRPSRLDAIAAGNGHIVTHAGTGTWLHQRVSSEGHGMRSCHEIAPFRRDKKKRQTASSSSRDRAITSRTEETQ